MLSLNVSQRSAHKFTRAGARTPPESRRKFGATPNKAKSYVSHLNSTSVHFLH